MKVHYHLFWAGAGAADRKAFKSAAAHTLFEEYRDRTVRFAPTVASGRPDPPIKKPGSVVWFCHPGKNSRMFSSEALAEALEKLRVSGVREWHIGIGDADGFSEAVLKSFSPDLLWSFGPATLPHELAAVFAAEQVYRAFTILNRLPYHSGH